MLLMFTIYLLLTRKISSSYLLLFLFNFAIVFALPIFIFFNYDEKIFAFFKLIVLNQSRVLSYLVSTLLLVNE